MAIVFLQERKTQKNLIFIFGIVMLITAFVIWQEFFRKGEETSFIEGVQTFPKKEVKINFEIFKNPILGKLQPFTEISPFKVTPSAEGKPAEKIGRENPFLSY